MALRAGAAAVARASSPNPISKQAVALVRTFADTRQEFLRQQDSIKQCWHKLSESEKQAADMVDKILSTTERVEQLSEKVNATKAAISRKQQLCTELKNMIDYNRSQLAASGQTSQWVTFHTNETNKRIAANAKWTQEYNDERVRYQNKLRSVLGELNNVKYQLEDADDNVRYIEDFRDQMAVEHEDDMRSLKIAIKEAYVTRNSMMSTKPDAMPCVIRQLLPDEEDYDQLVAETEDLRVKSINLKMRLDEHSKDMLQFHSKNYELSQKIKALAEQVKAAQGDRRPEPHNFNAHAHSTGWRPVTWFECPGVSIEKVHDFLAKHGNGQASRIAEYVKVRNDEDSRWHSQLFEKDDIEDEHVLEFSHSHVPLAMTSSSALKEEHEDTPVAFEMPIAVLTQSELDLCATATMALETVIIDDIGKVKKSSKPSLRKRIMSFFRRRV